MTSTVKLKELIALSGLKKKYIAEQLGLSTYGFQKKVNNENDFTSTEIAKLCKILNITTLKLKEEIFFTHKVD